MKHSHPILVTGAAGQVGAIGPSVTKSLLERGLKVRAMVRQDDGRAESLRALGAEVIVGDLLDLDAVHRAVDGCKRLYFSMSVNEKYLEATTNVAVVARHHGVEAFVNMSQMTVSEMSIRETARSPQHKQHWLAEQVLRWSGLPVVTMRPTAFMDAFFWRFAVPTVTARDALMLPFGEGKTSPIAAHDFARCVTDVLANPESHLGKVYELTGPRAESLREVAEDFTRVLGRPITYMNIPLEPWLESLRSIGASAHVVAHLESMALLHRDGRYDRSSDDVNLLTGVSPMSIEDFVRAHQDDFQKADARKP
ncbi:NmrA family NAD(P)-binding protein [Bradyrhizobium sp. 166]|uniref:NmrA family NAD(P)-binding protein n=1 Tax=Bradyrhizobium sp. 166 TaxID=2782638 RepID=UPI001FF7225A|nr:NmrA family NAD(P)-binding protein [Bradyrhizobium sp. 166]MCK1604935.1 NmrA family NAD(P)-binding protein [Bradyrhizobium sp. 166]